MFRAIVILELEFSILYCNKEIRIVCFTLIDFPFSHFFLKRKLYKSHLETLEYLNRDDNEDNTDIEERRLGTSRMLLAQETADLQKAIELSYYDMKATNEIRGRNSQYVMPDSKLHHNYP